MDTVKVRVKLGHHEFDAEGSREDVTALFTAWREATGAPPPPAPRPDGDITSIEQNTGGNADPSNGEPEAPPTPSKLKRVFSISKSGVVQLIVPLGDKAEVSDAALLALYGYSSMQGTEDVSALRVTASLRDSGYPVKRIDRPIQGHLDGGLVLAIGKGKGRRYRITAKGMRRAQDLVDGLARQIE
jgi:hypothetical protein